MRKKKRIKLAILILIIIALMVGIIKFIGNKEENTEKLANLYKKLESSQSYLFTMERNDENKTIMAKKGDKTLIDKYSENSHDTTLVHDNTTYYILHNREEYYVYNQNDVEQNYLTEGMKLVIDTPFSRGSEKINGKKYSYEEYQGSTIFMITNTLYTSDEEMKTRFYFDNDDNLVYIKTIAGVKQELLRIELSTEIDDKIFEIPNSYAENSYSQQ